MQSIVRVIVPLAVLVLGLVAARWLVEHAPQAAARAPVPRPAIAVETATLTPRTYQVMLESFGFVEPRTRSKLVAQVGGQIVEVNPAFRAGGYFGRGERLLLIDPRDYRVALQIRQAEVVAAEQALIEEQARVEQAERDWSRLGDGSEIPPLVARAPQQRAAEAALTVAQATLEQARLDLERTAITAPFAGRVIARAVDLGQVVASNTELGDVYAADAVEIALPLRSRDLRYAVLPDGPGKIGADVEFTSELAPGTTWSGQLVRSEAAIDQASRQLRIVARVEQPAAASTDRAGLRIGQYVTARIAGQTVTGALVIPAATIYQGAYVYVVADGLLDRREIEIGWRNADDAIVTAGLEPGDELVLTPLGQVSSGTHVRAVGAPPGEAGDGA